MTEANRLLTRIEMTTRCGTTGAVTMPTMLQVDIAILINNIFPESLRDISLWDCSHQNNERGVYNEFSNIT